MATPHQRNIITRLDLTTPAAGTTRSHAYIFCLMPFVILMLGVPCG